MLINTGRIQTNGRLDFSLTYCKSLTRSEIKFLQLELQ